jgi:hypothetical protein
MQRRAPEELSRFLKAVDRHLENRERVVIIGGAAAALHYGARRATIDIDVATTVSPSLRSAVQRARKETSLELPVERSGVFDAPYKYEDRLRRIEGLGLERLQAFVPEKHDLVLMKVLRSYDHDLEVIAEIHERDPLDLKTLVERFRDEMGHVVGDQKAHRLSLVLAVERLFGEQAATATEEELSGDR